MGLGEYGGIIGQGRSREAWPVQETDSVMDRLVEELIGADRIRRVWIVEREDGVLAIAWCGMTTHG